MEIQEQIRRPRFRRHRWSKPTMVLQPRDEEIIRLVADYRVITSEEIQALIPGSDQAILRRLQKLYHQGFLDRPRRQLLRGNGKMVYALGQEGASLLAKLSGKEYLASTDWSEKNRQLQVRYIEHALMISRFRAVLECACQIAGNIQIERWLPDGAIRESIRVQTDTGIERIPVAPDAFLTLRLLREPEGQNRIHAVVEADRGTMTVKRFVTKMRGYRHYWQSGNQEQSLGIRNFLVVTVTGSVERSNNLCAAAAKLGTKEASVLRMFVFTAETNYSLTEPAKILSAIWATPGDEELHSLLE